MEEPGQGGEDRQRPSPGISLPELHRAHRRRREGKGAGLPLAPRATAAPAGAHAPKEEALGNTFY